MTILCNILLGFVLWLVGFTIYMLCNHGLAPNARLQQLLRYLVAAVAAVVPVGITASDVLQPTLLLTLAVSVLWMLTYPLTYHLTHRKSSPDYDHQIDVSFGIYLYGLLSAVALLPYARHAAGLLLLCALALPVVQWVYYLTCHAVIDANGMKMLQETHYNEIIEFLRSYSVWRVAGTGVLLLAMVCGVVLVPVLWPGHTGAPSPTPAWWQTAVLAVYICGVAFYLWKPRHGLFMRTGIAVLYSVVKEYVKGNSHYIAEQQKRLASLEALCQHPLASPHTLLVVIGESASRDFMSAYTDMTEDTTPWLKALSTDTRHCVLFPNAYSCDIQTVPTLERALTEYNQYDGGAFFSSCSIVDVAHKLGYRVHWYSNQGHLGAADTPITLVAGTSDVASWTRQQLNKPQYDEALLDFLDEVDPTCNNVVVLHLKGSHFNYENRFTEAYRQWGSPADHDKITNYKNTLYYTDNVLRRAFEYARERLNLQAMVYFSDHADVPDRHRQPNFGGFRDVRIPLMVWHSDQYATVRPDRVRALHDNSQCYWTNDLFYDLFCGLLDVRSNHFREANSLASQTYRFGRADLTAMNGTIRISEDYYENHHTTS